MTDLQAVATDGFPKEITLPHSKLQAHVMKRATGRDMRIAAKAARGKGGSMDPIVYQFAMFAHLVRFGEEKAQWRVDQFDDLTEADIGALSKALSEDDEDADPLS